MKKISTLLIFFTLIGTLFAQNGKQTTINLLFTNDIHGVFTEQPATFMNPTHPPMMSGFPGFITYLKNIKSSAKQKGEGVLVFDSGNFFQGNPIAVLDSGKSAIELMNSFYDAMTLGPYDFTFGSKNIENLSEIANFPIVAANLYPENNRFEKIKPFIIKEINGIKVGVLGLVSGGLQNAVLDENLQGLNPITEVQAMEEWIPKVKKAGADIVIILSSAGIPYDREDEYEEFLTEVEEGLDVRNASLNALGVAKYAKGADLILTSGAGRGYPKPWYDPESHVYVFQNYGGGSEFGHIKIKIDSETKKFVGFENAIYGDAGQSAMQERLPGDLEINEKANETLQKAMKKLYAFQEFETNVKISQTKTEDFRAKRPNNWEVPSINLEDEIDIVTWNLEFFPASDEKTIEALSEIMMDLDADIFALQEIRHTGWLSDLMAKVPHYGFVISQQASFMDLAIVYKKDMFHFVRQVEPFAENDYDFAGRPPLRGDFIYYKDGQNIPLSIIDVHMKCCNSGLQRRKNAVNKLHAYVDKEFKNGNKNLILLGDWNDDLKDAPGEHSFDAFFNDNRFYFVNHELVYDIEQSSYPHEPWVSYLDHILVTEHLVPKNSGYRVQTILMDKYMGGMEVYEKLLSDHRPVALGFKLKKPF